MLGLIRLAKPAAILAGICTCVFVGLVALYLQEDRRGCSYPANLVEVVKLPQGLERGERVDPWDIETEKIPRRFLPVHSVAADQAGEYVGRRVHRVVEPRSILVADDFEPSPDAQ